MAFRIFGLLLKLFVLFICLQTKVKYSLCYLTHLPGIKIDFSLNGSC